MIAAKEAAALVVMSNANVDLYIVKIELEIIKLAKAGKRIHTCYVDGLWGAFDIWEATHQKFTPIQEAVAEKMRMLGYSVAIGTDGSPYVPRGLQDDDGGGPKKINVCMTIKW